MGLASVNTRNTIARDGYLCPKIVNEKRDLPNSNLCDVIDSRRGESERDSRVHLNGNIARRVLPTRAKDYCLWDDELIGFGLRIRPSGKRIWFVRLRQRGRHRRFSLGCTKTVDATTARANAKKRLAAAALDGLPKRPLVRENPSLAAFVDAHWDDLCRVWKDSTELRNRNAWRLDLAPVFGQCGVAEIARVDVVR